MTTFNLVFGILLGFLCGYVGVLRREKRGALIGFTRAAKNYVGTCFVLVAILISIYVKEGQVLQRNTDQSATAAATYEICGSNASNAQDQCFLTRPKDFCESQYKTAIAECAEELRKANTRD